MREAGAVIGVITLCLVVLGGIIFGGWEAGWWFRTADTNREAQVYQQSYGVQTSIGDALSRQITDISKIDVQLADPATSPDQKQMLQAQKQHEVDDACNMYTRLTSSQASFNQWATAHCGVVSY